MIKEERILKNLENWGKLTRLVIFEHSKGNDISIYSISKANLQIKEINQWSNLYYFIKALYQENAVIKDTDIKRFYKLIKSKVGEK